MPEQEPIQPYTKEEMILWRKGGKHVLPLLCDNAFVKRLLATIDARDAQLESKEKEVAEMKNAIAFFQEQLDGAATICDRYKAALEEIEKSDGHCDCPININFCGKRCPRVVATRALHPEPKEA